MRLIFALGAVCGVWFAASAALACGPTPSPYATIDVISPSDGAVGFPRDGAVKVGLKLWPRTEFVDDQVRVRVSRVEDGAEVEGVMNGFPYGGNTGSVTWAPASPLRAHTQYRVEVSTTQHPRADVDGPTSATATFTTSDELASPLELIGELRVSLRAGVAPVMQCGMCGQCEQTGERAALYADVTLPRVRGGFDAYGYTAWLALNDVAARAFDGPGEGKPPAPSTVDVLTYLAELDADAAITRAVELPREDTAYDACFGFNAWDASGHAQHAAPVCVPASELDGAIAELDEPTDRKLVTSGCSAAEGGGSDAFAAAVVLLFALAYRRRNARPLSVRLP